MELTQGPVLSILSLFCKHLLFILFVQCWYILQRITDHCMYELFYCLWTLTVFSTVCSEYLFVQSTVSVLVTGGNEACQWRRCTIFESAEHLTIKFLNNSHSTAIRYLNVCIYWHLLRFEWTSVLLRPVHLFVEGVSVRLF